MTEDNTKKEHRINVKGYFSKQFYDSQLQKGFNDIKYGYNQLIFIGTDKEVDEYRNFLVDNEGKFGFKII